MQPMRPVRPEEGDPEGKRTLRRGLIGCGCLSLGSLTTLAVLLVMALNNVPSCDVRFSSNETIGGGTRSAHLPIQVRPATDLVGGGTVIVTSDAFAPLHVVAIAVCLRSADTERAGVEHCDRIQGARYATDAKGHLAVAYRVPRSIRVGGEVHDCAASPGACLLAVGDVLDLDRSGGRGLAYRHVEGADPVPVPTDRSDTDLLPVLDAPGAGTRDGSVHRLTASGFQPGEPLLLARCHRSVITEGPVGRCEPLDRSAALDAFANATVAGDGPHADERGRFSADLLAASWIVPFPSGPADPNDPLGPPGPPLSGAEAETVIQAFRAADEVDRHLPTRRSGATPPSDAVDCTPEPGTCVFVIAAAADSKRSAILPYTVTAGR
jgi:hypothetical protein